MNSIKRINSFFWGFILLVILLQLSANEALPFFSALLYALFIIFTLILYTKLLFSDKAWRTLFRLNPVLLFPTLLLFSASMALLLSSEAILVLKVTVEEETIRLLLNDWSSLLFGQFIFVVLVTGLTYSFNQLKHYMAREKEFETIKRKALEMEINILRNQLSPHFTFNVLNNLQFLIIKDKDQALDMLSRYSKILQYYVYESQKESISLEREINFLKEYFDLETNRLIADLEVSNHWDVPVNRFAIVPFILSTFVENAFKHALPNNRNEYFVRQSCTVNQSGKLIFEISNTFDKLAMNERPKGVGLEHVKERLKLVYADQYEIQIQQQEGIYSVQLIINLIT